VACDRVAKGCLANAGGDWKGRTKEKLLSRSQHVKRERDFVLVAFALEPAEESGRVEHGSEEEGGCGYEEEDGCERCGI
jgi:hypothetical protein